MGNEEYENNEIGKTKHINESYETTLKRSQDAREKSIATQAAIARAIAEAEANAKARASKTTTTSSTGGKKTVKKMILGKLRCIYKILGSRKEYVKHKGVLITVTDYKKLMNRK